MTAFLIRHALPAPPEEWQGEYRLTPLSDEGRRQAAALEAALSQYRVDRVLSSPARRCIQTVEPLAASRGLAIEESPALAERSSGDGVLELVLTAEQTGLVLCSHMDVIAEFLSHLGRARLMRGLAVRAENASTWLIEVSGGQLKAARYLPAP
jgi:8-oxo-(d)GTP phosphatase